MFFCLVQITNASYSATDYDPSLLPYNFNDANKVEDYCNVALEQFDDAYYAFEKDRALNSRPITNYNGSHIPQKIGTAWVKNYTELKTEAEQIFRACISEYDKYQLELEEKEEEAERKRKEKEREEKRLLAINTAIENCDFAFFERMSESEKMKTYDERKACELKSKQEIKVVAPIAESKTVVSPVITPPVIVTQKPQVVTPAQPKQIITEVSSSSATTTEETASTTITITQEELDRIVQEKIEEAKQAEVPLQETVAEEKPKPSIFKRIINFFFGWF